MRTPSSEGGCRFAAFAFTQQPVASGYVCVGACAAAIQRATATGNHPCGGLEKPRRSSVERGSRGNGAVQVGRTEKGQASIACQVPADAALGSRAGHVDGDGQQRRLG